MAESEKIDKERTKRASGSSRREPALPAWKAFVVQFGRETGTVAGVYSGRVEHLSTGQRARFRSSEQLFAFIDAVLGESEHDPTRDRKK